MNKADVEKLLSKLRKNYIYVENELFNEMIVTLTKDELMILIYLLEILNDSYYGVKMCVTGKE